MDFHAEAVVAKVFITVEIVSYLCFEICEDEHFKHTYPEADQQKILAWQV